MPASAFAVDRSRVFSENLQALYSTLGSPDDLDRLIGTAQLDTIYRAVVNKLDLVRYFDMENTGIKNRAATQKLKARSTVRKSAYGELVVQVWDTDPVWSARMANEIVHVLQAVHQDLQNAGNESTLEGLVNGKNKLQQDSISGGAELKSRLEQYDKLIGQYQVLVDTRPPVLFVVEKAQAADRADKPEFLKTIVVTAFLAFLFGLLLALILDNRSKSGRA